MINISINQIATLVLKLSPFLFSIAFKFVNSSFSKKFSDVWSSYERRLDYDVGEDEEVWRYQLVGLYAYDRRVFSFSLRYSAFFSAVLHLLLWYQEGVSLLVLPAIIYAALGLLADKIAEKFFVVEKEGRNPDNYEDYYYGRDGKPPDILKSSFEGFLPSIIDRNLSPIRSSILIDGIILVNIGILEAVFRIGVNIPNTFSNVASLGASISGVCILAVLIVLVFQFSFSL
jgi:hypothetical protein